MASGTMNIFKFIRFASRLTVGQAVKIRQRSVMAGCIMWAALYYSVDAQTTFPASKQSPAVNIGDASGSGGQTIGGSLDYAYIGGGDVSFQGAKGESDAQSLNATLGAKILINDQWFIPLGIDFSSLFLGTVDGMPIPDQIDTVGFDTGLGYNFNDRWTFIGSIGPQFYRFDEIDGDDIGVNGTICAVWKCQPHLTLAFGLNFENDREPPVLPAAGFRWDIRTNLTLNLMAPRPALVYRVDNKFVVFAAGSGDFTVFRADSNLGNKIGQPQFNNALGTYQDFRIGGGAAYRLRRGLWITVEGGYSFGRKIDYHDIGQTVPFGNAPYIQVGLGCRF